MPVPTGVLQHNGHSQVSQIKAYGRVFICLPQKVLAVSHAQKERHLGDAAFCSWGCRRDLYAHSTATVQQLPGMDCALGEAGCVSTAVAHRSLLCL